MCPIDGIAYVLGKTITKTDIFLANSEEEEADDEVAKVKKAEFLTNLHTVNYQTSDLQNNPRKHQIKMGLLAEFYKEVIIPPPNRV